MLTFQEIGGSPKEEYSYDGFQATRTFLIPWEQRNEFAAAVFGSAAKPSSSSRLNYPGRKDVYACRLLLEPFDPASVNICDLSDLKTDYADYNGSHAMAVVDYRMLDSNDRADGPLNEEGTSITYKMVVESTETLFPSTGWRWQDTATPLADDLVLEKQIPMTTHYITWSNVVDPPWEKITARQGTVNNALFLGCAAETLLFKGAEANKLYRPGSGLDEGPSSFVWAIKYVFLEKAVKMNGYVYGWNHVYHPDTGRWTAITSGSSKLYDSSDFNELFRTVLPEDIP